MAAAAAKACAYPVSSKVSAGSPTAEANLEKLRSFLAPTADATNRRRVMFDEGAFRYRDETVVDGEAAWQAMEQNTFLGFIRRDTVDRPHCMSCPGLVQSSSEQRVLPRGSTSGSQRDSGFQKEGGRRRRGKHIPFNAHPGCGEVLEKLVEEDVESNYLDEDNASTALGGGVGSSGDSFTPSCGGGASSAAGESSDYPQSRCGSDGAVVAAWHTSALASGTLSQGGHVFTKTSMGPVKVHPNGTPLSSLCLLFENFLRTGGVHQYRYTILRGTVGAADGVGFVIDDRIRRTNIQKVRSIFLNRRGRLCIRNMDTIQKLPCTLPKLTRGVSVTLTVDLDSATACFDVESPIFGRATTDELSFACLFSDRPHRGGGQTHQGNAPAASRSGFFCAIVTTNITVCLQ
eukprot:TRINITY_DN31511_c0_g1_i1.p1 TRINITY_DN31511_c0_g1~~TRINITY_DN31511_c0_g1_i1.p1  ORF type:complete len:416 (-),score=51.98 TRINITY_DN31511_c0_g1_i1:81-1289(-)